MTHGGPGGRINRLDPSVLSAHLLGSLESAVLNTLWSDSNGTAVEITGTINGERAVPLSHKSVLTCLTRLESKGLVVHIQEGRSFRLWPTMNESETTAKLIGDQISEILDRYGNLAVAVFVERICSDPEHGPELRQLLEAKDEGRHS